MVRKCKKIVRNGTLCVSVQWYHQEMIEQALKVNSATRLFKQIKVEN